MQMMDDVGRPPAADAASVDSGVDTAAPGTPHLQVRTHAYLPTTAVYHTFICVMWVMNRGWVVSKWIC